MKQIPNFVEDIDSGERYPILPQEWDYHLVITILKKNEWEYSISFDGAIDEKEQKYIEDHYNYQELKNIAKSWEIKYQCYTILKWFNRKFLDGEYNGLPKYKMQYLIVEGSYSENDTIKLIQSQKQQLAEGWQISLEELNQQSHLISYIPLETPSCIISKGEEWFLNVDIAIPPVGTIELIKKLGEIIAFHNKEINRLHEEFYNTLHAPEERQYYKEVWGFDPAADRIYEETEEDEIPTQKELYRYEGWFPLENDPPLFVMGVKIGAIVQVFQKKPNDKIVPKIRIAFKRGNQLESVDCLHVVILSGTEENSPAQSQKKTRMPPPGVTRPVQLSIPEHFVALKSYVASIAEMGILRLLWEAFTTHSYKTENLGFGFNPEMQMQVMRALNIITPSTMTAIKRDWLMQLVDTAPPDWLASRVKILVQRDLLRFELEEIPKLFPADWVNENKSKLTPFFDALRETAEEEMELEEGIDTDDMDPDDIQLM